MSEQRVLEYLRNREEGCPHCGYSLRGLTVSQCPECGRRIRMAHLLGPRHASSGERAGWVALGIVMLSLNMYVVWHLWYHPPVRTWWGWVFVARAGGWRWGGWSGGFGALPVINVGLVIYAWALDELVGAGLRKWHLFLAACVLTAVYAGVGLWVL